MSIRTERVGEEVKRVLSERLLRGLREPLPGWVTVVRVEVTSDFTHAKVWVSVIGTDADKTGALHILTQERGQLRFEVGQKVRLRHTPELQFKLDESGEKASRVWQILDEERAKNPEVAATPVPAVRKKGKRSG
jgi:ribosome-binding factor A